MATYPKPQTTNLPVDEYRNKSPELESPAGKAFPIIVDQGDLPTTIRGLYIGSAGNVFCKVAYGNASHESANVFFRNVVAGTILPIRMKGVYTYNITEGDTSQNTTATFLVGLY